MYSTTPHPTLPIARQIYRLLWVSIAVIVAAFVASMTTFGVMSFWVGSISFTLNFAHNITNLVLLAKDKNLKAPATLVGKLPSTSHKATIICTWMLAFLWASASGTAIFISVIYVTDSELGGPRWFIPGFVEGVLEFVACVVNITLALKCTRERQQNIGLGNSAYWYQIGDYQLSTVTTADTLGKHAMN